MTRGRRTGAGGRRRTQWPQLAWLTVAWCLLWGDFSWANLLSGLGLGLVVTWLFPMPVIAVGHLRVRPWWVLVLVARFAWDVVAASLGVAWLVVRRRPLGRGSIIAVPLHSSSDVLMLLTCDLISLVPGSLVVDVRRVQRVVFIHVLDAGDQEAVDRARRDVLVSEARLIRAFGSDEEYRRLREAGPRSMEPTSMGPGSTGSGSMEPGSRGSGSREPGSTGSGPEGSVDR